MLKSLSLSVLSLAALCAALPLAAEIRLASGGKTEYTVVAPEKPTDDEKAAAGDLAATLSRITGAKFTVGGDAPRKLYVGKKAPSDKTPLKEYERRAKEENGDIYLYGNGLQGNTFAVYDFLEKYFNCRWYTFFGDMCIPEKREAVFDKIDLSVVPSFDSFGYFGDRNTQDTVDGRAFRRRARVYDLRLELTEPFIGSGDPHILSRMLPPGVPLPSGVNQLKPPFKYFEDKAYFKTNPEYFAMNAKGNRVPGFQACFSNPGTRKTLIENSDILIKNASKGGPARVWMDLNDKGHYPEPVCSCPECMKLHKKYADPAGAYWDFLFELCGRFAKKYPEIKLMTNAYNLTQGTPKFPGGVKTPKNLVISIAPLGTTNFMRTYKDTPRVYNNISAWNKVIGGKYSIWLYPTVYRRPLHTHPLVANINRIVENLRQLKQLGVDELTAEFGCGPHGDMGFNELRFYLISVLARDINADVGKLIGDFMAHYYGKAAPLMRKYLSELEECEAKETNWMRYWPDHRAVLQYLTPENLLRWQGYFDEMEKLTSADAKANMHVRRARTNLDEATMSVWYKFAPGEMPDRDMMYARYKQAVYDAACDRVASLFPESERAGRIAHAVEFRDKSMYYHYALAGKWRPLPAKFAKLQKAGRLFRLVPYNNRRPRPKLSTDAGAAAGIALEGTMPKRFLFQFTCWPGVALHNGEWVYRGESRLMVHKLSVKKVPDDRQYHYYYIGTTRLWRDSLIRTDSIRVGTGVVTGLLFDPKNPEQRFDVYISLKRDGQKLWFDEMLFVKSDKKSTLEAPQRPKEIEF